MASLLLDLTTTKWPLAENFFQSLSVLQKAYWMNTVGIVVFSIYCWFSAMRYPGLKGRFSLTTRLAYFTDCEGLFRDAYETHWLVTQPDNVLSIRGVFREIDQIDWAGDSYDSRK
ncbi:hypothetical protein PAAG_05075 [Paracoccidioides lutzii Pb01]|uniref:Uncharacterized protein n=1 Tax=Paracoccidioides lutzii (strain ATCC MYA-826 / Pb01) TaxID=502779 RepID=C1H2T2_PARBA|nr:hypothetical protein PAAG_05075 [Paracoccidioides lutzii Pb01]EEH34026.2 hypothetical protein PAAG_05075 [Paracoccidioides lutzii Pb01]